jgi:hypothetical protein
MSSVIFSVIALSPLMVSPPLPFLIRPRVCSPVLWRSASLTVDVSANFVPSTPPPVTLPSFVLSSPMARMAFSSAGSCRRFPPMTLHPFVVGVYVDNFDVGAIAILF